MFQLDGCDVPVGRVWYSSWMIVMFLFDSVMFQLVVLCSSWTGVMFQLDECGFPVGQV